MIAMLATGLGCILLLLGSCFALLGAIGVLRLPDLYTRMHAASKAGAVGGGMILVSVALVSFDPSIALRAVIGAAFLLLTTPVSAHLLARVSHRGGYHTQTTMFIDELAAATASKDAIEQ